MTDDYDYFRNKRPDRVYLSKALTGTSFSPSDIGEIRIFNKPFRIVSKVIDAKESHEFIKDGKEVSLRITSGERHEIVAKFYEDNRQVFTLQIQKYTVDSGMPHKTYFSFVGKEIAVLFNFLRNIELLPLESPDSAKLDDKFVDNLSLTRDQAMRLVNEHPDLLRELMRTQVTAKDIAELSHQARTAKRVQKAAERS